MLVLVGEPHCLDAEEPREADVRDGLPLPPTSQLHSGSGRDYLGIENHLMERMLAKLLSGLFKDEFR